jgi:hypothetical protein
MQTECACSNKSTVIYGNPAGARAIALAHYTGSSVSTYLLDGNGQFHLGQTFTFNLTKPGTVPDRQDAPRKSPNTESDELEALLWAKFSRDAPTPGAMLRCPVPIQLMYD